MKSPRNNAKYLALYTAAILIVACTNQMEPAKNALDNINASLAAVSADAQKYVPDQFADAQSKVAAMAASYDKKDYPAVLASAPGVLHEVNGLASAAAAKKDELLRAVGNEWRGLEASVPQVGYSSANARRRIVENQACTERHRSACCQIRSYRRNIGVG